MSQALKPILDKLQAGGALDEAEIDAAFAALMSGTAPQEDIKAFLSLTAPRIADPKLIAGGARAMRARMVKIAAPPDAIDVCGTGGDGAHTLNISTTVAFVLAGAGVPVAKHGNRAMSSKSGAADVLEALGVKLTHDAPTLERALREAKIAFLFAQAHHPAMRYVAQARRELNHRTIFNLLGPLTNPAGVKKQLVGVFDGALVKPVAEALASLGCERGWIVHGAGGKNIVATIETGAVSAAEFDAAADGADPAALAGGSAEENAAALRALLEGSSANEAYRNAVELNAGAAFVAAGLAARLQDGIILANHYLRSGAGLAALDALIDITNSAP
ncbi:MAG TPA: anthranilate phosphoribosyltransferase [Caulobacterales bacterium]|nr:anthranilate phosphoribosyltransferase [Caulobacterales bacterium]